MRQTILLGVGVAVIVLGYLWVETQFDPVKYEREHIEQKEGKEVITEPEYPEEWLKEAEAAAEAVIQKRKLEAERDELIESRTEIQERINEIEKELSL